MDIFGEELTYQELLRRCGNLTQLAGIQQQYVSDGPAYGIKQYRVRTGNFLDFTVIANKCMDIGELYYRGINISYLAKPGLSDSNRNAMHQRDFLKAFNAGMLYTCGLSNVGTDCVDQLGEYHPQHGRIANSYAENTYAKCFKNQDKVVLKLGGSTREAELFGRNIVLSRTITTEVGSKKITINDFVENQTSQDYPICLLYHFNFGYPFISEATRIFFEESEIHMKNTNDSEAISMSAQIENPIDGAEEQVFVRKYSKKSEENNVRIENRILKVGVDLSYSTENLPFLIEWKSMASGDYVLAIEPSTCEVLGRNKDLNKGNGCIVKSFDSKVFEICLEFYDL